MSRRPLDGNTLSLSFYVDSEMEGKEDGVGVKEDKWNGECLEELNTGMVKVKRVICEGNVEKWHKELFFPPSRWIFAKKKEKNKKRKTI